MLGWDGGEVGNGHEMEIWMIPDVEGKRGVRGRAGVRAGGRAGVRRVYMEFREREGESVRPWNKG